MERPDSYIGVRVKLSHRLRTSSSPKVTSFVENKTALPQEEAVFSKVGEDQSKTSTVFKNNNKYDRIKYIDQSQQQNGPCNDILRILSGILGILLLTALILPSTLLLLLLPKSSPTELSQLPVYGNHCAGVSPYTLWQINSTTTITMMLNTSECSFSKTPLYFVSITGLGNHFCLSGYGAIYLPTTESFQIYAKYTCSAINSTTLLSMSQTYIYNVTWMGFYK